MAKKTVIKLFLVIGAILLAGYLSYDVILQNIRSQNENRDFCDEKCSYSKYSYFWEFKGGNTAIGFTTKDECLRFCIKQREGFASLLNSPPVSDILRFFRLK